MVLNTEMSVLRKIVSKTCRKGPFGEGQVQDLIPALLGQDQRLRPYFRDIHSLKLLLKF
jgi:hypothetical protein